MLKILITWEHGTGLGHLVPLLPYADALKQNEHSVAFAVRDDSNAYSMLESKGFKCFRISTYPEQTDRLIQRIGFYNYCRLLISLNYHNEDILASRIKC